MLTKSDFLQAIVDTVPEYPAVASLYRASDPRILQHLSAMATMLSMLSAQMEVSTSEVFERARESTILADAAMRGIIRKARPGRVRVTLSNTGTENYTVAAGRNILDSVGNIYRIDTPAIVAPSSTATVDATQIRIESIVHTVSGSRAFYAIEIPESDDGSYLSGVSIKDADGDYEYRERYVNTGIGDRVFHIEADDRQKVYVRFGQAGVVATQPINGQEITLNISRSFGSISPASGSPFSFEYYLTPLETLVNLSLHSVLDSGSDPISFSVLRDLIKYPSVYDFNSVFLGEFDHVVRRTYHDARFLSIWNESAEEIARGADEDNINALFVACLSATGSETVLTEASPGSPVAPTEILEVNLTSVQKGIRDIILNSDDSYKVRFYTPVRSKIVMTITATISTAYTGSDVQSQIRDIILTEYGEESKEARRGSSKPLYQSIYKILREKVEALAVGSADLQVSITPYAGVFRPELWRYVASDSLTVTVTTANITISGWS